jgi:hypothetical protein
MHHAALGVANEIWPRSVLFDLTGPGPVAPGMLVVYLASPTALQGESRKQLLTDASVERAGGVLPRPASRRLW